MASQGKEEAPDRACRDQNEACAETPSLQDAFRIFREKKRVRRFYSLARCCTLWRTQRELRERSKARDQAREVERDEATLERLRNKFLQTALSYCGVPYARRYHEPDCEFVGSHRGRREGE